MNFRWRRSYKKAEEVAQLRKCSFLNWEGGTVFERESIELFPSGKKKYFGNRHVCCVPASSATWNFIFSF